MLNKLKYKSMNLSNKKIELIGNITSLPQKRRFANGKFLLRFSVLTEEIIKKDNKFEKTHNIHNVIMWGHNSNTSYDNLIKGSEVIVSGELISKSYITSSGDVRHISEILAESLLYRNLKSGINNNRLLTNKIA